MSIKAKYTISHVQEVFKKLKSNHILRQDRNIKTIFRDYLNDDISKRNATNKIKALGLPHKVDQIYNALGTVKNDITAKMVSPELEMTVISEGETAMDIVGKEEKLAKISKDARKNGKKITLVDPKLGLHAMIADIEYRLSNSVMTEQDVQRYMALKLKVFTDMMKYDSEVDPSHDIERIQKRMDDISIFMYDVAARIDQLMKDVQNEVQEVYGSEVVIPIMSEIRKRLDVKQLLIKFIDDLNFDNN